MANRYCPSCNRYINSTTDFEFCSFNWTCPVRAVHKARNLGQTSAQNFSEDEVLDGIMTSVYSSGAEPAFVFSAGDAVDNSAAVQSFVPAYAALGTPAVGAPSFDQAEDSAVLITQAFPDSHTV